MTRTITCIVCPRGCVMTAEVNGTEVKVTGNACPRGQEHAVGECTNPVRTLTSIVRVSNREDTMVSVKTDSPIPKGKLFEAMERIRAMTVEAPVKIGDVILAELFGARLVATKTVE